MYVGKDAEQDLVWFYQHAEADMGIQSSFEPIRYAIIAGADKTSKPDTMSDRKIEAAHRYRKIEERLQKMHSSDVDVIHAAYAPVSYKGHLTNTFGANVGAVQFCSSARKSYECDAGSGCYDSFFQWLEGVVLRGETDQIELIGRELSGILRRVHRTYSTVAPIIQVMWTAGFEEPPALSWPELREQ